MPLRVRLIHELRRTAGASAIGAGANVKAVQKMLGHVPAAMTLDAYADLFDDDLDAIATRLDQAALSTSMAKRVKRRLASVAARILKASRSSRGS